MAALARDLPVAGSTTLASAEATCSRPGRSMMSALTRTVPVSGPYWALTDRGSTAGALSGLTGV